MQTATHTPTTQTPNVMLSVYGADRPGIVAAVARAVADHGGNITDLNTRVIGSPDRPVYAMVLEIHVPGGTQRSEEHTPELQSLAYLVCRLLLEKKDGSSRPAEAIRGALSDARRN